MRKINMQAWPRRQHFEFFNTFDNPHFGMCANIDLTAFYPFIKQLDYSINLGIVYVIARAANAIPEFRYRIREGAVVEHEIIHPATTILSKEGLFNFCTFEYTENFSTFISRAEVMVKKTLDDPALKDQPGRDDLMYTTAIPWVSFTNFKHPMHFHPADSVPRLAWGKFFETGDRMLMPLDVQTHHALMDGFHMGSFFEKVQGCMHDPGSLMDEAP